MSGPLEVIDLHPPPQQFESDLLRGLSRRPRSIPPKYFYDARGSELFDQITQLPSYYPTRTEMNILRRHADEIAELLGPDPLVIEPGSGSSHKVRPLLEAVVEAGHSPLYMPIEISHTALWQAAAELAEALPGVTCRPVCADFTRPFDLPEPPKPCGRRTVFFPGSTLGNFHPPRRLKLLQQFARLAGPGGGVLIGLDLTHDPALLKAAYDDPHGVTAEFNRNVLRRANAELGAGFDLEAFEHWAGYCPVRKRVEMRLVSRRPQRVHVSGRAFDFEQGEWILTECSYKFALDTFHDTAGRAGLTLRHTFTDPHQRFGVLHLQT